MIVHQYLLGPMENFMYILEDPETSNVVVVDPAWDVPYLIDQIKTNGWTLDKVLLTHAHYDHANGVEDLLKFSEVPVYLFHNEIRYDLPPVFNVPKVPITALQDGDTLSFGATTLDVLHTPGHSPGCVCFISSEHVIAGDLIFVDGCGRVDLPGGDPAAMFDSLQRLKALPEHLRVWSGHRTGAQDSAVLSDLKRNNPYLVAEDRDAFFSSRGV